MIIVLVCNSFKSILLRQLGDHYLVKYNSIVFRRFLVTASDRNCFLCCLIMSILVASHVIGSLPRAVFLSVLVFCHFSSSNTQFFSLAVIVNVHSCMPLWILA